MNDYIPYEKLSKKPWSRVTDPALLFYGASLRIMISRAPDRGL